MLSLPFLNDPSGTYFISINKENNNNKNFITIIIVRHLLLIEYKSKALSSCR